MKKLILMVLMVGVTLGLTAGCSAKEANNFSNRGGKINVLTSFYPMYEFTRQVGGDRVEVKNLVPPGAEPHDWEPSPQDMVTVSQARLLIYNGAGFEGWVEKLAKGSDNPNLVLLEASKGIPLLSAQDGAEGGKGGFDSHVWLDPQLAKAQLNNIKDGLIQVDPANKDFYESNAKAYGEKLDSLDKEFQETLAKVPSKEIITTHSAFTYLAHRYGLTQMSIMGLAPDSEPKPQDMAEIANFAKAHHVRYIFFETLVSPKVAETIAREVQAETLVLNPLEGLTNDEIKQGQDYISKMRENLANLKKALGNGQ